MPERRRARAKSVRPRRPRKASRTAAGWSSSGRYSQVSPGPSSTRRSQPAWGGGSLAASTRVARSPTAGTRMARSLAGVAATTTRTGSRPSGSTTAVAASRSNTGPCSAMRRHTATPSRRTSPSWVVGGPSTTASIPNGRNDRGDSARPSTRSGLGSRSAIASVQVPVPDDPEPVEGEPGLVVLDGLAGLQHRPGQPAGGDHGRGAAQLGHHAPDDPVDLPGEAPDGTGLEALDGVLADHRPGCHQLDPAQLGGPLDQGVHGDLDAGGDGRAQVLAPLGDGVEGGGGAEVDHHHRPPVGGVGGDGVDHPVGPDLARVVGQDGQPGADPGLHDQRVDLAVAPDHLAQGLGQPGHDRGDDHPLGVGQREALLAQEPAQQQSVLVGGALGHGGRPPVLGQLVALEHPDGDLGVADVHGQEHQSCPSGGPGLRPPDPPPSQSNVISSEGAEWVRAPTARKSTPVSATARAPSRVIPPEASVRARRPQAFTAAAMVSRSMLSSSSRSQPRSRASATWSRVSTSTSRGSPGPAARAASTARRRPPAAWMWLSLTSRASYRPMRWLAPPPQRTAYFSR